MYVSIYAFFPPAWWVASLRPRMGGEPPWFLVKFITGLYSWIHGAIIVFLALKKKKICHFVL